MTQPRSDSRSPRREPFRIADVEIAPGTRQVIDMAMPKLSSHTNLDMPVHVIHGRRPGPVLFLSAAIHGDELNGIEIIRRVLATRSLGRLRGTLIAVPVVNVYGLIHESRYLPDRRDLNRSFPGTPRGSLAARLAHLFIEQVVKPSDFGIDLHTGAVHRANLPQIRANLDDPATSELAHSFGVPVLLNSSIRDGSLRAEASELGIPILLYEAGEALRYDDFSIRAGVAGVLRVMRKLEMLPAARSRGSIKEPFIARSSVWVRASESGIMRTRTKLGQWVKKGDPLGHIDDPYSDASSTIHASVEGVVIGKQQVPLVYEGDAVFHIARFRDSEDLVTERLENFQSDLEDKPAP